MQGLENLKNLHSLGCFWPKYVMFEFRKYGELCLMALKIRAKMEGKLACTSKNDMMHLADFHQSTWQSQNWDFDGIVLAKVEIAWA